MSMTSHQLIKGAQDRTERVQRWTAALLTALLHLMLVLLVMAPSPPPVSVSAPQGEADGGRMTVTLIDTSLSPLPPEPEPAVRKPPSPKRPKASRAIKRPLPTPVVQAAVPMPPAAPDASDTSTLPPTKAPEPPDAPSETVDAESPADGLGQPPGMRLDDAAIENAALAAKLGGYRGRGNNATPIGRNLGVDGFQVYYDLVNETLLRAWRDQGMTELFLPLPGTLRVMVCPLEVALRRGSGACRMLERDSPELKSIGDAREVINMQQVYHLGDVVWSGPGPYR